MHFKNFPSHCFAFVIPMVTVLVFSAQAQTPDPHALLEPVRMGAFSGEADFSATLRSGSSSDPFRLEVRDGSVTYTFANPEEKMRMEFSGEGSRLLRSTGDSFQPVARNDLGKPVRGTDITLEDLSLWFLYWRDAKYDGEHQVGPRRTHKITLRAPRGDTHYAAVNVWVDQETGTLMQMYAYNWEGAITKRFRVVSGQRIEGQWMLKEMRVESVDPGTKRVTSRSYLAINEKL